jgi:hypothetical protein
MTTIGDLLRQETAAAKQDAADAAKKEEDTRTKKEREKAAENERIDANVKASIAHIFDREFALSIKNAAQQGKSEVEVPLGEQVYSWDAPPRDPLTLFPQRVQSIAKYLPEYLIAQGCQAEVRIQKDHYDAQPPCSDDGGYGCEDHDVYTVFLVIKW